MCQSAGALTQCPETRVAAVQTCSDNRPWLVSGKNAGGKLQLICGLMENSLGHLI